jgi:hypothetical protein
VPGPQSFSPNACRLSLQSADGTRAVKTCAMFLVISCSFAELKEIYVPRYTH